MPRPAQAESEPLDPRYASPKDPFDQLCCPRDNHRCNGERIVGADESSFFHAPKGADPARQAQTAFAVIAVRGDQIEVLNNPLPSFRCWPRHHLLACQVKIKGAGNVYAVFTYEEAERSANPGIHVKNLVQVIPGIIAVSDVQDASITDGPHEASGSFLDNLIAEADSQAG